MHVFEKTNRRGLSTLRSVSGVKLEPACFVFLFHGSGELLPRGVGAPVEDYGGESRLHGIRA